MILTICLLLFAYLLGSVPSGLWIGQIFYHKDLRREGSGNTGTTNTFRILGVKSGVITFTFDLLKGTLATLLPLFFHLHTLSPLIFGLLAVLGHTFSVFDRFHGGKAVATSGGVILGFNPLFLIYLLLVFLLVLVLFSMISLSSITAALAALVGIAFFPLVHFILPTFDWLFSLIIVVLVVIIFTRHKDNLRRIKHRTESIVPFGLNLSKQSPHQSADNKKIPS
jgi:glycerol-3-phosphate acyltransferase PlsY